MLIFTVILTTTVTILTHRLAYTAGRESGRHDSNREWRRTLLNAEQPRFEMPKGFIHRNN